MLKAIKKSIQYGAHTLTLETGEIARQAGCAVETISRYKAAHKDKIVALAQRLIAKSSKLIEANHIKTLELAGEVLNSQTEDGKPDYKTIAANKDLLTIADKKEYRTMLMMGIVPGGAPGPIIQQIIGEVNLNLVDAGVRQLLGGQLNRFGN